MPHSAPTSTHTPKTADKRPPNPPRAPAAAAPHKHPPDGQLVALHGQHGAHHVVQELGGGARAGGGGHVVGGAHARLQGACVCVCVLEREEKGEVARHGRPSACSDAPLVQSLVLSQQPPSGLSGWPRTGQLGASPPGRRTGLDASAPARPAAPISPRPCPSRPGSQWAPGAPAPCPRLQGEGGQGPARADELRTAGRCAICVQTADAMAGLRQHSRPAQQVSSAPATPRATQPQPPTRTAPHRPSSC